MNLEPNNGAAIAPPLDMSGVRWAVDGVARDNLEHVWEEAWPYLQWAIKRGIAMGVSKPYTEAEVYRNIMRGEQQLWIGWSYEEDRVVGAVLTEITTDSSHPGHKFLSIPLVGGEHWMNWGDSMWILLKKWGVAQGCTEALAYGRKGWSRLYGFDQIGKTEDGVPVFLRRLKEH